MLDKDTLLHAIEELERVAQEHPDTCSPLMIWTLNQMLDRSTDRWGDGFRAGISTRLDVV